MQLTLEPQVPPQELGSPGAGVGVGVGVEPSGVGVGVVVEKV